MKVLNKILSWALTIITVLMIALAFNSLISKNNNYGIPHLGPYSVLVIKTDSMEPTLNTNTGIIIKKVSPETLKPRSQDYEGDIVTYYRRRDNAIVTHRLVDVDIDNDLYVFFGDNIHASSCNKICDDSQKDYISSQYIIGKVVNHSDSLGHFYLFITNKVVQVFIFIIPIGYLIISSIISGKNKKIKED